MSEINYENTKAPIPEHIIGLIRSYSVFPDRSRRTGTELARWLELNKLPCKVVLYRGQAIGPGMTIPEVPTLGDEITLPMSSFSEAKSVADAFSNPPHLEDDERYKSGLIIVAEGKGRDIQEYTLVPGQREWICSGKYRVEGSETSEDKAIIYLTQIK